MSWERNVCPNSPPRLGGVAAPLRKCSRSLLAQTGWYGMARSDLIDIRAALLIHGSTTPPFAKKRASGTPPNLACYVLHLLLDTGALKTTGGKAEVPSLDKEG